MKPRLELDEQKGRQHRCEWPHSYADSVFNREGNSRIHSLENDGVEARRLRGKEDGCSAE